MIDENQIECDECSRDWRETKNITQYLWDNAEGVEWDYDEDGYMESI